MGRHLVGELAGVGEVFAGELLLRSVPYRLSLWADGDAGAAAGAAQPAAIDGFIDISSIGEAVVLAGAETLTLRLQDGRRLSFTLVDSAGRITGRGAIV
jgi:hypothetical protein